VRSGSSNREASKLTLAALKGARRRLSSLDAFERRVLEHLESVKDADPNAGSTIAGFARAHNVGLQRSKRAFTRLEREGFVVGVGVGAGRRFRKL
jgi:hypothetical protein